MLLELRVENFAVIDRITLRLEPGLNVLTGETGAGKSLVVGALSLLLGERASADLVRPGAERAVVEGVFDIGGDEEAIALLAEQGIDAEDGLLILRREVALRGRNRAWVNGAAATAGLVGSLGGMLVDLHGQHEHQTLLKPADQRAMLDAFASATPQAEEAAAAHAEWRRLERQLVELDRRRQEVEQRSDFLRFQLREIEAADLSEGEEDRLEEEARRLEHAEELARIANELHVLLYSGEEALAAGVSAAMQELDRLLRIDASEAATRELLESAYYALEEAGRRLGAYGAGIEHEPRRLQQLRQRQDVLFRLFRKYGEGSAAVLEVGARVRAELDLVQGGALSRRELEREVASARARLEAAAAELTRLRSAAAERLKHEVEAVLPELGLRDGRFEVELEHLDEIASTGAESVEYRVSLNRGFEPRPLARVASGGELSRVMLALKTILARLDRVPSLVFDEIDAGIGGRTAHRVAAKLKEVAGSHQVFAITHLPQIAARADLHLLVEKVERDGAVATRVSALTGEERLVELVRMLGGDPDSAASLRHARELLGVA